MPDLSFRIEDAHIINPNELLLGFALTVSNTGPEPVHSIALRCQIQIEAARRRYESGEQENPQDLFGEPQRWNQTLRTFPWTQAKVTVGSFRHNILTELPVPCALDDHLAPVKYFRGLRDGDVPLCFQFAGSIFYESPSSGMQIAPIPWDKEAKFRMPVRIWKELMAR